MLTGGEGRYDERGELIVILGPLNPRASGQMEAHAGARIQLVNKSAYKLKGMQAQSPQSHSSFSNRVVSTQNRSN